MDDGLLVGLVITFMALAAGLIVIFAALRYRTKVLELRHAERLALIERGLAPSPEISGLGFDGPSPVSATTVRSRSMSVGIVIVGLGLALICLIGIAGESLATGIGIGGATVVLGGAFIVRSLVVPPVEPSRAAGLPPPGTPRPMPPSPSGPS